MSFRPNRILIYGVGLMGASLAYAIRKKYPDCSIDGVVRSKSSLEICENKKLLNQGLLESDFLMNPNWNDYDLVVFGTPVDSIVLQIDNIPKDSKTIYTDMGSTKQSIIDKVNNYFPEKHNYISSHPMCGSEQLGASNAIPDLYENKLCIITTASGSNENAKNSVIEFWQTIGMKIYCMQAKEHDRVLAYLSHSPHILSSLMAIWANKTVGEENQKSPMPIMGGGFRDMARIAGSNPEMWKGILAQNKLEIIESLRNFQIELNQSIELLENGNVSDWEKFFEDALMHKNSLLRKS
ncbi:prephenate dehydrogenase [Leptospira sp. GIMC2001]|uniref:prephenate dehydrogenase n=1 Tax=Leptospira sp. GIMC2001 TaxID=1513297 RepID=UPI00234BFDAC|nr:prephenate dehydrogenase/arogenate dehydrogenase family protein [Leptospira sp. GIMC2001]WCL48898.1 prephenate dehydrogenase/arogenate dehydrogenase family protein [Leptospira sp. GIMC2001]